MFIKINRNLLKIFFFLFSRYPPRAEDGGPKWSRAVLLPGTSTMDRAAAFLPRKAFITRPCRCLAKIWPNSQECNVWGLFVCLFVAFMSYFLLEYLIIWNISCNVFIFLPEKKPNIIYVLYKKTYQDIQRLHF